MILRYALRRLVLLLPVLVGVTVVVFTLIHVAPGDPVMAMLGQQPKAEDVARVRHDLGLDDPVPVQYLLWLSRAVRGDLGHSLLAGQNVSDLILQRSPTTIALAASSMAVAILIGIPIGILSATRRNSRLDNGSRAVAMLGVSMPVFWLGLLLIIVFALQLRLLPPGGSIAQYGPVALVLPAVALGASFAALIMRLSRSAMLEVLGLDYIRTARAKGLSPFAVEYRHALKNAAIPIVTVIGLQTGTLLSGAILTETVFALPGLGRLLNDAVNARDYPLVLGSVLVIALVFVLLNLLVDVLYVTLDPRIRYS